MPLAAQQASRPYAARLIRVLVPARTRDDVVAALAKFADEVQSAPYEFRGALAAITGDAATSAALAFPAVDGARTLLDRVDDSIDVAIRAVVVSDALDALAADLARSRDAQRLERTLRVAFDALGPPASRARASLIDLLRAHPLESIRLDVYRFLVAHDTDVRNPLADDAVLDASARLEVLAAYARRLYVRGRRTPIAFDANDTVVLARALGDWTRHASHPRQVVFACEHHTGDRALATRLDARALPGEVSAWLAGRTASGPVLVAAGVLGGGRFECARCGAESLLAEGTRRLEEGGRRGIETSFVCRVCATVHHASWDDATLGHEPPPPAAWIESG